MDIDEIEEIAPEPIQRIWDSSAISEVTIGDTDACVLRLQQGADAHYLKISSSQASKELAEEAERTAWAFAKNLPVPAVVHFSLHNNCAWLLTRGLPGETALLSRMDPIDKAEMCARALHALHAQPVGDCPFHLPLDTLLKIAEGRVRADLVDETDFDLSRKDLSAQDILDDLKAWRPGGRPSAITHGDATLENLILAPDGQFWFVDCGRLGVSDPARDVALMARSIRRKLGHEPAARFLGAYDSFTDSRRLEFYEMLDELF